MAKIALDTIRSLLNYLNQNGVEKSILLNEIGLTEQELNKSRQALNTQGYQNLLSLGEELVNDPLLGFHFGQTSDADRWGILGYIAFTSATLKDALTFQRKYHSIVGNIGTPVAQTNGDTIALKWIPTHHINHHIAEEIITGWIAMARKLSGKRISPKQITFSHSCRATVNLYQDYFGCAVNFDADVNGITIDSRVLDTPLIRHDPELNELLRSHADKILQQNTQQLPIESLKHYIRESLSLGVPDIEQCAVQMNTSVRTLQRKLKEHQTSYSDLIESIRQQMAIQYLTNTATPINHIAQALGFSEQSAFQRAFKRWTGSPPKQFRNGVKIRKTNPD